MSDEPAFGAAYVFADGMVNASVETLGTFAMRPADANGNGMNNQSDAFCGTIPTDPASDAG